MSRVFLLFFAGCVPFALPPVTGNLGARYDSEPVAHEQLHLDVGFAPLQLDEHALDRRWDATLSGSYDRSDHNAWGTALAGGPIIQLDAAPERANRLLPQLVARWTTDELAAGVRVAIEHAAFTQGESSSSNGGMYMLGEAAIGAFVEADAVRVDASSHGWAIVGGVTFRLPATAGLACCIH